MHPEASALAEHKLYILIWVDSLRKVFHEVVVVTKCIEFSIGTDRIAGVSTIYFIFSARLSLTVCWYHPAR